MMDVVLTFLSGLLLRLGLPIAVTILLLAWLRRLDKRWQKEALALPVVPAGKLCWEIKGCSEDKKKNCAAAAQPKTPCWQVFRTRDGVMKETCLGCDVFRQAPVPVRI
jgi:hypothetical protein